VREADAAFYPREKAGKYPEHLKKARSDLEKTVAAGGRQFRSYRHCVCKQLLPFFAGASASRRLGLRSGDAIISWPILRADNGR
jgi:hypothetical protein